MTEKTKGIAGGLGFALATFVLIGIFHPHHDPAQTAPTTQAAPSAQDRDADALSREFARIMKMGQTPEGRAPYYMERDIANCRAKEDPFERSSCLNALGR